ncbi:MAG: NADH-quinone oxidoreductase subunit B, partial [Gammaproteobacteria bacterium]|nr:NADH-quinone oxidoreductase subunit B [Gammaproteobacteria bacterium]
LQDAVKNERRPLSWVVDDQTVKPVKQSQRDIWNEERMRATTLRGPDEV